MSKVFPVIVACLLPLAAFGETQDPIQALDDAEVARALELLKTRHIRGSGLDERAMSRATLRGLLEEWRNGAELQDAAPAAPEDAAFRSETFEGGVGYVRLGSIKSEHIAQLDAALRAFTAAKVEGVVLDLRATPESQDFKLAAQAASRFVPAGTKLWSLAPAGGGTAGEFTSEGERLFDGTVVVVADGQTSGAPEALVAALRHHARALVVGSTTAGRAAEFAVVPLGESEQLRLAVAEVKVPGLPPLYPDGLAPDIEVRQDGEERDKILAASLEKGAAPFVFERERARLNEAALVARTNPEIAAAGEPSATDSFDRPLQRAVDLVTAISLFQAQGTDESSAPE